MCADDRDCAMIINRLDTEACYRLVYRFKCIDLNVFLLSCRLERKDNVFKCI